MAKNIKQLRTPRPPVVVRPVTMPRATRTPELEVKIVKVITTPDGKRRVINVPANERGKSRDPRRRNIDE